MKIFKKNISRIFKNSVLAVGNFDGIHLGHKKVLNEAFKKAKKNKIKFGLLTFEPIPVMFFNKKIKNHRLNSISQKIFYLKKEKLDFLILQKFDKRFSNLNYENFIKKILYQTIKCKYLYVSNNFKFGKNRDGNVKKLLENQSKFKIKTIITKPFKKNKKIISSSIIRRLIRSGKVEKAKQFLGRNWEIEGKVIKGEQRGRKIGFPTCNIDIQDYVLPKHGVYSVMVNFDNYLKKGIANVGFRPTFNGKKLLLEVNIFGIKRNLYNKMIKVRFLKFIRAEKKFKNLNELKKQIKVDIKKSKQNV
tara:strand:- start:12417 stop:13328 length:912 start_codon:yes stop_codon:yes gene_type:complete